MPIMETMERKKSRPRRSFTPEFKAEIVDRCRAGDRSIGQVARDFDLTETAVRKWVEQARIDAGEIDGLTTEERQELTRLRRENQRLQTDVDRVSFAKKAVARLSSGEDGPLHRGEGSRRSQHPALLRHVSRSPEPPITSAEGASPRRDRSPTSS
jgi:transposase